MRSAEVTQSGARTEVVVHRDDEWMLVALVWLLGTAGAALHLFVMAQREGQLWVASLAFGALVVALAGREALSRASAQRFKFEAGIAVVRVDVFGVRVRSLVGRCSDPIAESRRVRGKGIDFHTSTISLRVGRRRVQLHGLHALQAQVLLEALREATNPETKLTPPS